MGGRMVFSLLLVVMGQVAVVLGADGPCAFEYEAVAPSWLWDKPCDLCWLETGGGACGECRTANWDNAGFDVQHQCHRGQAPAFNARPGLLLRPAWLDYGGNWTACRALAAATRGRSVIWLGDSVTTQLKNQLRVRCGSLPFANVGKTLLAAPAGPGGGAAAALDGSEAARSKWAEWRAAVAEEKLGDVIVLNLGLHYHTAEGLRYVLDQWAATLRAAVDSGRLGAVAIAETTAQHFSTSNGGYEGLAAELTNATMPPRPPPAGFICTPPSVPSKGAAWRNVIAHEVAARYSMPVARFGAATEPLWDVHLGGSVKRPDCTHFCYAPGLVDAIASELTAVIGNTSIY